MGSRRIRKRTKVTKRRKGEKLSRIKTYFVKKSKATGETGLCCSGYQNAKNLQGSCPSIFPKSSRFSEDQTDSFHHLRGVYEFSKVRKKYFHHLQKIIVENCCRTNSDLTGNFLEEVALELERHALLACMQARTYQKTLTTLIHDIRRCTQENVTHSEIRKLISTRGKKDAASNSEIEKVGGATICSRFCPLPSSAVAECDRSDAVPCSTPPTFQRIRDVQDNENGQMPVNGLTSLAENNYTTSSYAGSQVNNWQHSPLVVPYGSQQSCCVLTLPDTRLGSGSSVDVSPKNCSLATTASFNAPIDEVDEIVRKNKQMQKPVSMVKPQLPRYVEQGSPKRILDVKVDPEKKNYFHGQDWRKLQQERAAIEQILQGDDSSVDGICSMEENEKKSLTPRMGQMSKIFGGETTEEEVENKTKEQIPALSVPQSTRVVRKKAPIWLHEKNIRMHKLSLFSLDMTLEKCVQNKTLLLELFGDDSDDENEDFYRCEKKYLTSCIERISSWVVKYLMPFYHARRIFGRSVFKSLGHHISESIVAQINYPDERCVKYFVDQFFVRRKCYTCEADVRCTKTE